MVGTRKPKSQETVKQPPDEVKEDQGQDTLFSCPNVGCIKVYQRHCALENHLFYGKCEYLPVREILMDKAKVLYHDKLVREASALPFVKGVSHHCATKTEAPPQGWALRSRKKSTRFSEAQRCRIQRDVARDIRYARNQQGAKLVTVDEFLTAQQIQSYFLRRASKLRHSHSDDPESEQDEDVFLAAEEELAHQNVCTVVLNEVALKHPVVLTFSIYVTCVVQVNCGS